MKKIIGLLLICSFSLIVSDLYCQELTDRDRQVHREIRDAFMSDFLDGPFPKIPKTEETQKSILREYGLTAAEFDDVMSNVAATFTPRELNIGLEFWERYRTLPKNASRKQRREMLKEVSDKYGVTEKNVIGIAIP